LANLIFYNLKNNNNVVEGLMPRLTLTFSGITLYAITLHWI